jgi:tetratricopeptide (TPR) repeat protein
MGAFVAVAVFLAASFWIDSISFRKKIGIIGLFLLIIILTVIFWPKGTAVGYNPSVGERLLEVKEVSTESYGPVYQRLLIWKSSYDMLQNHPVLGVGWGALELFYPFYQGGLIVYKVFSGLRTHANNSHNEVLEILSQIGLLGFGIYLWLLAVFGFFVCRIISFYRKINVKSALMIAALASAMAGMWVDNLLNVTLHFAVPTFLFWWFMGIIIGVQKDAVPEKSLIQVFDLTKNKAVSAVLTLSVLCGVFLIYRTYKFEMNQILFFKGFKVAQSTQFQNKDDMQKVRMLQNAAATLLKAHEHRRLEVNNNYELGNAYARLRYYDKTIWAYQEALRANAGYDEIYFNMATVYNQHGDFGKAIEFYSISNAINPRNKEVYTGLSNIYIKFTQEKKDEALYFTKLEELIKRQSVCFLMIGISGTI